VRLGIGAWIAWTLAMTLLAIAVAAIPNRPAMPVSVPPAVVIESAIPPTASSAPSLEISEPLRT
jgi:hypothetical protein